MTSKDAYKILEAIDRDKLSNRLIKLTIKAIKKRVPLVPDNMCEKVRNCPSCGKSYEAKCNYHYCPNCGQAVDWKVIYEKNET